MKNSFFFILLFLPITIWSQKLKIEEIEQYEFQNKVHYKLNCLFKNNTNDTIFLPSPEEELTYSNFQNINNFYQIEAEPISSIKKLEEVPFAMDSKNDEKIIYKKVLKIAPKESIRFIIDTKKFFHNFLIINKKSLPKKLYLIYNPEDINGEYSAYKFESTNPNDKFFDKLIKSKPFIIKK